MVERIDQALCCFSHPNHPLRTQVRRQGLIHQDHDGQGLEINRMGTGNPVMRTSVIRSGKTDAEAHLLASALATRSGPGLTT